MNNELEKQCGHGLIQRSSTDGPLVISDRQPFLTMPSKSVDLLLDTIRKLIYFVLKDLKTSDVQGLNSEPTFLNQVMIFKYKYIYNIASSTFIVSVLASLLFKNL
jgi:hypothetical protein